MSRRVPRVKPWIKWSLARLGLNLTLIREAVDLGSHLRQVLCRLGINCVLDVGAYRGNYGIALRRLGYRGRIVSFEPVPTHYAELELLCAADSDWWARNLALGSHDGEVEINVLGGSTFSSILRPSDFGRRRFGPRMEIERRERVPLRRLDSVYDKCVTGLENPRVCLKTDTQGFDLWVIEGAGRRLDAVLALQIEVAMEPIYEGMSNRLVDVLPALEARGFGVSGLFPVTRDPADELRVIEFDCVMCRAR